MIRRTRIEAALCAAFSLGAVIAVQLLLGGIVESIQSTLVGKLLLAIAVALVAVSSVYAYRVDRQAMQTAADTYEERMALAVKGMLAAAALVIAASPLMQLLAGR